MVGPGDRNEDVRLQRSRSGETLAYLCEIILELQNLAERTGHRTLSAILAAALVEARAQNDGERRSERD